MKCTNIACKVFFFFWSCMYLIHTVLMSLEKSIYCETITSNTINISITSKSFLSPFYFFCDRHLKSLLIHMQFKHNGDMKEELSSASLPTNTANSWLYKTMKNYTVHKCASEFKFQGEVYSDGTDSKTGKYPRGCPD